MLYKAFPQACGSGEIDYTTPRGLERVIRMLAEGRRLHEHLNLIRA